MANSHSCPECGKTFGYSRNARRHYREIHNNQGRRAKQQGASAQAGPYGSANSVPTPRACQGAKIQTSVSQNHTVSGQSLVQGTGGKGVQPEEKDPLDAMRETLDENARAVESALNFIRSIEKLSSISTPSTYNLATVAKTAQMVAVIKKAYAEALPSITIGYSIINCPSCNTQTVATNMMALRKDGRVFFGDAFEEPHAFGCANHGGIELA